MFTMDAAAHCCRRLELASVEKTSIKAVKVAKSFFWSDIVRRLIAPSHPHVER